MAEIILTPYLLLIAANAFFVIMGETRRDAIYWLFALMAAIYLLIERPEESVVPIPIFVGWIFAVLYQAISLLATGKAVNLSGHGDE